MTNIDKLNAEKESIDLEIQSFIKIWSQFLEF